VYFGDKAVAKVPHAKSDKCPARFRAGFHFDDYGVYQELTTQFERALHEAILRDLVDHASRGVFDPS
jgi:hypothetical protein